MRINTNLMALNTKNQLKKTNKVLSSKMSKLSSGKRINKAADDAAGLAINQKMRAQIRGLKQGGRNIQDAISLVQTGESALEEIGDITQRMRELSVQAANDTLTNDDRGKIQNEIDTLKEEINSIANNTEFNNIQLLNGIIANDTYTRSFDPAIAIPENGEIITQNFDDVFPDLNISMDFHEDEEGKIQIATKEKTTKGTNILGSVEYDKINDQPSIEWEKDFYSGEPDVNAMSKIDEGVIVQRYPGSIVTIDENGNELWNKELGFNVYNIKQTSDDGYLGLRKDNIYDANGDFLENVTKAVKLDKEGEIDWQRDVSIGYNSWSYSKESIIELKNNEGYAYVGKSTDIMSGTDINGDPIEWREYDSNIKVFQNNGTLKWEKTYEGFDQSSEYRGAHDNFADIAEDNNGNIIAVGVASYDDASETFIQNEGIIRKFSANGVEISDKIIERSNKNIQGVFEIEHVRIDSKNSIIITDTDHLRGIKKLNENLEILWSEKFDGSVQNVEVVKNDNLLITTQDTSDVIKTIMLNSIGEKQWEVELGKDDSYSINKSIRMDDGSYLFSANKHDNIVRLSNNKTLKMSLDETHGDKNMVTFDDVTIEIKNGKLSKIDIPYDGSLDIQVGANEGQQNNIAISDMRPEALGMTNGYPKVVPREAAEVSIEISDHALKKINAERSKLGAKQNALEHTQKNVDNSAEQLQSAESQITDADMAKEMMEFTKYNILKESTQSMLSQAKTIPEQVLNLLKNG